MAVLTLTFPPGTCATISKSGSNWVVDSVNATTVTLTVDDTDNNGTISGAEWDAAIGGGGNDTGGVTYLFEGSGASGTLYATDGTTTFTVGQNVTSIKNGLTNTFEADVSGVVCFNKGTMILTDRGAQPIEAIYPGAQVDVGDGRMSVVRWVGRRKIPPERLFLFPKLRPVRITAGALGCGLPMRDLLVSRQHRILVSSKIVQRMFGCPEVLVAAIRLTELPGIHVDCEVLGVEYFHLLFDYHELVYANGARAESLYLGPNAVDCLDDEARSELLLIFPELDQSLAQPEHARHVPENKRQAKLAMRHRMNRKPLLD